MARMAPLKDAGMLDGPPIVNRSAAPRAGNPVCLRDAPPRQPLLNHCRRAAAISASAPRGAHRRPRRRCQPDTCQVAMQPWRPCWAATVARPAKVASVTAVAGHARKPALAPQLMPADML